MKIIITESQGLSTILRRRFTQEQLDALVNEFQKTVENHFKSKRTTISDLALYVFEYSIDFARDVIMEKLIDIEPESTDPDSESTFTKVELLTNLLSKYLINNFKY
jgi:hypothetical protein